MQLVMENMETWPSGRRHLPAKEAYGLKPRIVSSNLTVSAKTEANIKPRVAPSEPAGLFFERQSSGGRFRLRINVDIDIMTVLLQNGRKIIVSVHWSFIMKKKPTRITRIRVADEHNQVITVSGGSGCYRRTPCPKCPWRVDATGEFPAEAFRHSANTAYDMANETFGCHASGSEKPATCAGFLLRGAEHNMTVRVGQITGAYKDDVHDGGHELHANYRVMAIANGVPEDDPVLRLCRD